MKKIAATTLALLLLAGCASNTAAPATNNSFKTGLGVVTSVAKSTDAAADKAGLAEVDSMIAAVSLDADGKLVKVSLDSAQTKINFDATGKITTDIKAEVKTKNELGTGYGMIKASSIGKEWYQQADAFATWAIGKTPAEVQNIKVKTVNNETVADVPELASSVTISVTDFQAAIAKAAANAK